MVSVDADSKTLELDAEGAGEAGIHLRDLVKVEEGSGVLEGSIRVTRALSRLGWRINLYAEGEKVASLGSGVSRLSGGIGVNPLKLRKLLKALKI